MLTFLPQQQGFLGLPESEAGKAEDAKAVVIPFGLEASVSYGGGTAAGPQAMIDASPELEMFDEELWCEAHKRYGVATLDVEKTLNASASEQSERGSPEPVSLDCVVADAPRKIDISHTLNQLEFIVESVLAERKFPMTFGGEHSITAGAIRPFAKRYEDLCILHFDAHADLRDGYLGEPYSHAAALRRCVDDAAVAHNGSHITLVSCGIRNISAEEIPYLESQKHRIHIHWGKDMKQWDVNEIVAPLQNKPIYLTFDVDGFDASLMPATGTPEPGGMFWADIMPIIQAASKAGTIVGADVNELAPIDGMHGPNFVAAKLAYKIMSFALV